MAIDVSAHIEIKRDSKAVAAYAFEQANDPIWIGGISQAKLLTSQPIGEGTQVQRRARFMGRTIDYVLEVRTLEPDHLMVMESIKSPFPMNVTYRFDALDTGTTLAKIRVHMNILGGNSSSQGVCVKPWRESGTQTGWRCWSLKAQNRPGAGTPPMNTRRSKRSASRRPTPGSFRWRATRLERDPWWGLQQRWGLPRRFFRHMKTTGGQKRIVLCLPVPYATQLF